MDQERHGEVQQVLESMTASIVAARAVLKTLQPNAQALDFADGISLLSLKQHVLISYLRSLALVSARRTLGHSLAERSQPTQSFSSTSRQQRGMHAGDLVDSMIEDRIVLEKVDALENRMRYQIEKLLKVGDQPECAEGMTNDPLAFKPNPQNLVDDDDELDDGQGHSTKTGGDVGDVDGIYRPPHLAPMPYIEKQAKGRRQRLPVPSALATLPNDPSRPHIESSSGLGGIPSLASGRAKYLKRLADYEEDNFTRVMMKKTDAKRRARDEEDLALGGDLADRGLGRRRRRAGGLEDEFGDVLRSVERGTNRFGGGDGYEELRRKGKKQDVLLRSRTARKRDDLTESEPDEGSRIRKRSRFDLEAKTAKKKIQQRRK